MNNVSATGFVRATVCCLMFSVLTAVFVSSQDRQRAASVYKFTKKPAVERKQDRVLISFAVKEYCDVTVAIEDKKGTILRHLASGVLGSNAPEPFQKNSKSQEIVWDGKDDQGRYVAQNEKEYAGIRIRVSLGLKAQMERTLFWSPKKRPSRNKTYLFSPVVCPVEDGVYVYDGGMGDHLKFFDHSGNYVRTVYPFPHDKIKDVAGMRMHHDSTANSPMPLKWNRDMATMLTLGWWSYGGKQWPDGRLGGPADCAGNSKFDIATAMAVHGKHIALARLRLNRLATDGSSGGLPFHGPDVWFVHPGSPPLPSGTSDKHPVTPTTLTGNKKGRFASLPASFAFSPDGKWLYMTGYLWELGLTKKALPGVARMAFSGDKPAECWLGSMDPDKDGTGNGQFRYPLAVDVDGKGRVYVCDYMNNRIQIFSPDAKLLSILKTPYPAEIEIDPKSGELYVFSWALGNSYWPGRGGAVVKPVMTRYSAYPELQKGSEYTLPLSTSSYSKIMCMYAWRPTPLRKVAIDFHTDKPMLWFNEAPYRKPYHSSNLKIYEIGSRTLKLKRDFVKDVENKVSLAQPPEDGRMRVYVDPRRNRLYVHPQGSELVCIDPESGRETVVKRPFDALDMAFDINGYVCFRHCGEVMRFEPQKSGLWREVPFDYGEERRQPFSAISALIFPGAHDSHPIFGGIGVNVMGCVALASPFEKTRGCELDMYPGRSGKYYVSIFDKHGKPLCMDAFKGASLIDGVRLDRDGNVYVQVSGLPAVDGKLPSNANRVACTLIKGKPGKVRMYSKKGIGVPLPKDRIPDRAPDFILKNTKPVWLEGAEWIFGDVGMYAQSTGISNCHCSANARFDLDYYARSFCTQVPHYRIVVLDSNGNVILHIGRCGNIDEGMPLIKQGGPPSPRSIGGDEVAIMNCLQLAVHTDKRLFLSDIGNYCVRSVKLDYHVSEVTAVKTAVKSNE